MNLKIKIIFFIFCLFAQNAKSQNMFTMHECVNYALDHNEELKKSVIEQQKSTEARREIMGSFLPQLSASGNMNYNIKKAKFIMPNFVNAMLPQAAQDPAADKYMTIEMGTNYSAGIGAALNQQLINFPLINTLNISKIAEKLAELGVASKKEELIAQTASLFYAIQATHYAALQMNLSIDILDSILVIMQANYANGLLKKIDIDRMKVTRVNMSTQALMVVNAVNIQKNLLKLQMGLDMNQSIELVLFDITEFEHNLEATDRSSFLPNTLVPFRIMERQLEIGNLTVQSAKSETLPILSLGLNYQYNFVSDEFFKGEDFYSYPASAIGLNLRVPIFSGFSHNAKIKGATLELQQMHHNQTSLLQSLNMAYQNAILQLEDSRNTITLQKENRQLAKEVYRISASNYNNGLAPLSDVLNAHSSLIQAEVSYADALNNYMNATLELKKANGSISEFIKQ